MLRPSVTGRLTPTPRIPSTARKYTPLNSKYFTLVVSYTLVVHSCGKKVDTENETMRMREGWEVWLLPNQATGKQGVPRYIKVEPETESSEPSTGEDGKPGEDGNETGEDGKAIGEDEKEAGGDPEEVRTRAATRTGFIRIYIASLGEKIVGIFSDDIRKHLRPCSTSRPRR